MGKCGSIRIYRKKAKCLISFLKTFDTKSDVKISFKMKLMKTNCRVVHREQQKIQFE